MPRTGADERAGETVRLVATRCRTPDLFADPCGIRLRGADR
jgi:hypothetical protein